jgi:hypothetical protein
MECTKNVSIRIRLKKILFLTVFANAKPLIFPIKKQIILDYW